MREIIAALESLVNRAVHTAVYKSVLVFIFS